MTTSKAFVVYVLFACSLIMCYQQQAFSAEQKPPEPHFFDSIEKILESNEFTNPKPAELIFISIGCYNYTGMRQGFGYAQALPTFVEKMLTNQELKSQLKIILIDPNFTKEKYPKSDLAYHLKENDLEQFNSNFYLVHSLIKVEHFNPIENYLDSVLSKGGAVFLSAIEVQAKPSNIYDNLIKNSLYAKEKRLFFMQWQGIIDLVTRDKNKLTTPTMMLWDGKPFNPTDYAILFERTFCLSPFITGYIKTTERLLDLEAKKLHISISMIEKKIKEEKESIEEYIKHVEKIKANPATLMQEAQNKVQMTLQYHPHEELSITTAELVKLIFTKEKLACTLGSFVPTYQLPLIDFNVTLIKTDKVPTSVKIKPLISVDKNQFDFIGLMKDEKKLQEFVHEEDVTKGQSSSPSSTPSSSSSTD